jgi:predicted secreted protein
MLTPTPAYKKYPSKIVNASVTPMSKIQKPATAINRLMICKKDTNPELAAKIFFIPIFIRSFFQEKI